MEQMDEMDEMEDGKKSFSTFRGNTRFFFNQTVCAPPSL